MPAAINAGIESVRSVFTADGVLQDANPSTDDLKGSPEDGFTLDTPLRPGGVAELGLTAIPPRDMPGDAEQAVKPEPLQGGITGVVWRDFRPGGGTPGEERPRARRSARC